MTDSLAPIRRCPECGEEFLPHIVQCSDCGAPLVDAVEGGDSPDAAGGPPEPAPPSADYVGLVSGLTAATAEQAAQLLGAAGIPFAVVADLRRGLRLGVTPERVKDAIAILERENALPKQPDPADEAVAIAGGPCPACGDQVQPGTTECGGCGLSLASPAPECRHCGAELVPPFDACPECAREQD